MKKIALIYFIVFLLASCSEQISESKKVIKTVHPKEGIFNLSFLYSEGEKSISFPIWFNDSIIQTKNIVSIERTTYYPSLNKNTSSTDEEMILEKRMLYEFNKNGAVELLTISNYYDNRLISTIKANYSKWDKTTGYAKVELSETLVSEEFPYIEYTETTHNNNLYVFQNSNSNMRLMIIPNKENWKALVIDTLCKPSKEDIIVWGSIIRPEKTYSIQNLVEERNVRTFTYKNDAIQSIDWTDHPFNIHRTFQYNSKGACKGFVDSTFSMGGFVSATNYSFELKGNLPVSVTKTRNYNGNKVFVYKEVFTYKMK
jgi:hypothetical protein